MSIFEVYYEHFTASFEHSGTVFLSEDGCIFYNARRRRETESSIHSQSSTASFETLAALAFFMCKFDGLGGEYRGQEEQTEKIIIFQKDEDQP